MVGYKATLSHAVSGGEMIVYSTNTTGNQAHRKSDGKFTTDPRKVEKYSRQFGGTLSKAGNDIKNFSSSMKGKKNPPRDLSMYSDKELQQMVNRARLEEDYDRYYNKPEEAKGKKFVEGLGTALWIAGSVITIAGGTYALVKNIKGDAAGQQPK